MGMATFIHILYIHVPYGKQNYLLFCALQASASLCKHGQKEEEAYTKELLEGNQRIGNILSVQVLSHPTI